mmetsp:Transcript_10853/g.22573  ORF Transcript_10853/g.22573 Transcript_10853/m.22573 type:complete len:131 (+) Transcript_10853:361-753(+)
MAASLLRQISYKRPVSIHYSEHPTTFALQVQTPIVMSNKVPGTHGRGVPSTIPALQYMYCVQSAVAQYPVKSAGQSFEGFGAVSSELGDDGVGAGLAGDLKDGSDGDGSEGLGGGAPERSTKSGSGGAMR